MSLLAFLCLHAPGCSYPWPVDTLYCVERYRTHPRRARLPRFALWFARTRRIDHDLSAHFPPDLYGRGYSDAPHTTYDTRLYTSQLAFLMQYLRWEKANIVGLSMVSTFSGPSAAAHSLQGGGIAAAFTAQFPHLVDDAVGFIASGGLIEVRARIITMSPCLL
jgi:pimeloyl-ACP methyl ester carboxylesterase